MRMVFASILVFLAVLCIPARAAETPQPLFDSIRQVELEAEIRDGVMLTPTQPQVDNATLVARVKEQLHYLLGQFSYNDGAPRLNQFDIQIGSVQPDEKIAGMSKVHYTARGYVAWARAMPMQETLDLVVPARGDADGLNAFIKKYLRKCVNDSEADEQSFFYYFTPYLDSCPLSQPSAGEAGYAARFPIYLKTQPLNSKGKSPEYGKFWEDGKFKVVALFSKYVPGAQSDADVGINTYNVFYWNLRNFLGIPTTISDVFYTNPGADHPSIEMVWERASGDIIVDLELVDSLSQTDAAFRARYNEMTKTADLVAYNGHSELGANIDVLTDLGSFQKGRYQLFFVNGCGTFAHMNDHLWRAHAAANPGFPASKHLDIISNAVSVPFNQMPNEMLVLMSAILRRDSTYQQILSRFDGYQRAVVEGEEDNRWPAEF